MVVTQPRTSSISTRVAYGVSGSKPQKEECDSFYFISQPG